MDNTTLPPLFDNMDNVDISSPSEEPDIFQSAIQVRNSIVFLINFRVSFSAHHWTTFQLLIQFNFFAKLLSFVGVLATPISFMLVDKKENKLIDSVLCWQDADEPTSPTSNNGTMEDVITSTERESGDRFIEISVEEPAKVGDGMNSYLAYK